MQGPLSATVVQAMHDVTPQRVPQPLGHWHSPASSQHSRTAAPASVSPGSTPPPGTQNPAPAHEHMNTAGGAATSLDALPEPRDAVPSAGSCFNCAYINAASHEAAMRMFGCDSYRLATGCHFDRSYNKRWLTCILLCHQELAIRGAAYDAQRKHPRALLRPTTCWCMAVMQVACNVVGVPAAY